MRIISRKDFSKEESSETERLNYESSKIQSDPYSDIRCQERNSV